MRWIFESFKPRSFILYTIKVQSQLKKDLEAQAAKEKQRSQKAAASERKRSSPEASAIDARRRKESKEASDRRAQLIKLQKSLYEQLAVKGLGVTGKGNCLQMDPKTEDKVL